MTLRLSQGRTLKPNLRSFVFVPACDAKIISYQHLSEPVSVIGSSSLHFHMIQDGVDGRGIYPPIFADCCDTARSTKVVVLRYVLRYYDVGRTSSTSSTVVQ